jgi:hypothetical protein
MFKRGTKVWYENKHGYGSKAIVLKYIPIIGMYKIIYRNIFTNKCKITVCFKFQMFERYEWSS